MHACGLYTCISLTINSQGQKLDAHSPYLIATSFVCEHIHIKKNIRLAAYDCVNRKENRLRVGVKKVSFIQDIKISRKTE